MSKNSIILSYKESLLRQSDVELLQGPFWLNDNIITFYFEYLSHIYEHYPGLLFVSPEVTQCIKIIPDAQVDLFLGPLDSKHKDYILFALNDNERPQSVGGTHWSLLVFSGPERTVFHYDSSCRSNSEQAQIFATKLFKYFNIRGTFKEQQTLQQSNGYDCGIHLICNAECLAKFLANDNKVHTVNMIDDVRSSIINMRNKIIDLIGSLKKAEM